MSQSLIRGLRILSLVGAAGAPIGVRELARQAGLSPATTQALAKALTAAGYLEWVEPERKYRIGLSAIRLGDSTDRIEHLRTFVSPTVKALAAATGETIVAAAWNAGKVMSVDWIESQQILAARIPQAVVDHPHCLASGKLLLAFRPEDVRRKYAASEPLKQLGPNSPSTPRELEEDFQLVRRRGYAEAIDVGNSGVGAVAVPVFDFTGRVVLALACSAPLVRFKPAKLRRVRQLLTDSAAKLTKTLVGERGVPGQ